MKSFVLLISFVSLAFLTHPGAARAASSGSASCEMASEGLFKGTWVKHRIYVNDDVVYGADDMDSILSQLENLRGQGLCR